jgi:hypothetical protein
MLLAPTLLLNAGSGAAIARPTFSRDFAGEKTLNNGTGPAITFTRASNATFFDANGTLQTAANDTPRFDHDPATGASRGLLIEEARTNSIRNSQAGGSTNGVIGSGGALPTNWGVGTAVTSNGVSTEIIGTGTEVGLAYLDLKISGTPTASGTSGLRFDTISQVVAANGQSWTSSMHLKVVAGTTSNITLQHNLSGRDAAGGVIAGQVSTAAISPTGSALSTQRVSLSRTMSDATVERVLVLLNLSVFNGDPIDLTLRIAAPQLEQGAFATSYIPTTTAAATRAADSAVVTPISSFYNQSEGTLFAEGVTTSTEGNASLASFAAASNSNQRFQLRIRGGALAVVAGGVTSIASATSDPASGAITRRIGAAATDNFAACINGGSVETDSSGGMPSVAQLNLGILIPENTTQRLNGHIRRIAYYPRRLSNTLLQQLTT